MRLVYNTEVHLAPNIQTVVSQSSIKNQFFDHQIHLEPWTFLKTKTINEFRFFISSCSNCIILYVCSVICCRTKRTFCFSENKYIDDWCFVNYLFALKNSCNYHLFHLHMLILPRCQFQKSLSIYCLSDVI